ncbi:MAG: hypothetical protein AB8I08_28905 [Sandaracinaceae bacterium]
MLQPRVRLSLATLLVCVVALVGCQREIGADDASTPTDSGGGAADTGTPPVDAGPPPVDAGRDAGPPPIDAGSDAGPMDSGTDAGDTDAGGTDAGTDAGGTDAGETDAGGTDAGGTDGGAGTTVVYPLDDRSFTDETTGMTIEDLEAATMMLTVAGVTMTLAANDGVLNQTASGFGINHSGGTDDTDGIDGNDGVEVLTVTFGVDVSLTEIDFSSFSSADEGAVVINGGSPTSVTSSGVLDLAGAALTAGQTLTIAHVAGNGFQVDSITVTVP